MSGLEKIEKCYQNIGRLLWKLAYSILKDEENAYDAVHTIFLRLMDISKIENMSQNQIEAYATQAVKNYCFSKQKFDKNISPYIGIEEISSTSDIVDETILKIEKEKMLSTLEGLSPRYKKYIYLKFFSELDNKKLASIFHIGVDSVRMLQTRALRALRKEYFSAE